MNPMIRKEIRQRMRERKAWILPTLYLVVLGAAVVLVYVTFTRDVQTLRLRPRGNVGLGQAVFLTVAYLQLGALLLIAPVFSAGALTIEKEQRTLAGLLTSLLTPFDIWWGKCLASLLYQVLLVLSALPILTLAFALGGVGLRELSIVLASTLVVLVSLSAVGLACSAYFRRSVHATAVTYGVVIALSVLSLVAYGLGMMTAGRPEERWPEYFLALNPFFALSRGLFSQQEAIGIWLTSLLFFAALSVLAAAGAVAQLHREGEQR